MLTMDELKNYHRGFEFFDPFGKGRMRELVYDYRLYQINTNEELDKLKQENQKQAEAIDKLVKLKIEPNNKMLAEKAQLEEDLKYANLTIDSLTQWANRLEGILAENGIKLVGNRWVKEDIA